MVPKIMASAPDPRALSNFREDEYAVEPNDFPLVIERLLVYTLQIPLDHPLQEPLVSSLSPLMRMIELAIDILVEVLFLFEFEIVLESNFRQVIKVDQILWHIFDLLVGDQLLADGITQVEVILQPVRTPVFVENILAKDHTEEVVAYRKVVLIPRFPDLAHEAIRVDCRADEASSAFQPL